MSGMPSPSPSRINGGDRDKDSMWYFSSDDLATSPSRKAGISPDQELSYRQMTAYLIQEMGQRLQVSQLCINTAIVYMHRFYAFHSFTHFHRNGIAAASLFLAAKVEEQPRKLEHVIKAANKCLNQPTTSTTDTYYLEQAQDLVFNENVLLQTLGFDVAIDHPHTHVVKTCHLVKACKDLAQTSYFLASNSLHLTSMCLQYKPTVVACFCIYLACKWSRWEIPQSTEGKHWFHYVDETVTMDLLKKLTDEFIAIYEKSPARLKSKLNSIKALAQGASNRQGQVKDKKADQDWKVSDMMNMKMYHPAEIAPTSSSNNNGSQNDLQQQSGGITQPMLPPPPHPQTQQMRKTELHTSSQHRSHHSSSSSSATSSSSSTHHPPKLGYTPGDVPDHKLSKQQQQQQPPYGSSSTLVSNRPPREHTTSTSQHPTAMLAPSSNPSTKSSSRSSMSNSLTGQPSLRHSSTQGHAMDVNYKSRDRGLTAPPPPTAAHSLPPHGMQHKLSQKQDGGSRSMSSKDHTGRLPAEQQSKLSSNSNKVFSTSSSSQYGSNSNNQTQLTTGSTSGSNQASVKLENLHDMSRNMMHNTRGGYNNPPPPLPTQATTSATAPLLNFHQQQQQGSRHSNSNSSSSSSSLKLEQSKQQQISVHMQQQPQTSVHQHHQHHQKQPLITATDPTTYPGLTGATHDLQQPPPHASLISNNYSKIEPLQHSEDPHHPNVTTQYNSQAQNQVAKAANSVFSPDWSDKLHAEQMQQPPPQLTSASGGGYNNNGTNMTQNSDIYAANFNIKKESPPKIKTERDTPSKKDKNRSSSNSQQDNGRSSGHNTQNMLKTTITKKLDTSLTNTSSLLGLNELAGTSSVGVAGGSSNIVGGVKRPNEQPTIKTEDDLLIRDSKIRKLDGTTDIGKHQVVNGIETNPDLVRNLLKESLLPITSLLKTETSIITPSLEPPAELFEPSATTSSSSLAQPHNTSITLSSSLSNTNNNNVLSGNSDISAMETDDHANTVSKSEKKKKKDKHKHKEKDKSKDREERKKHKKDKDRHKDKERDNADNNTSEHVKIKISKEKLESAGEPIGFKIKIPKERLMGDLSGANTSHAHHNDSQAPPVLKIKISKDKLESYSSGSADMVTNMTASTHSSYAGHTQSTGGYAGSTTHTSSGSSSSSSNKKKDRDREKDRERDKDKKRSHDSSSSSVSKSSNGGAGGGSSMTVSAAINNTTATNGSIAGSHSTYSGNGAATTQKTQNSSKIHHQSNMSLLFGESNESNDDDDDDYNDDY